MNRVQSARKRPCWARDRQVSQKNRKTLCVGRHPSATQPGFDLFAGAHTAHSRNHPTVSVGSAASFRIDRKLVQKRACKRASTQIRRIASHRICDAVNFGGCYDLLYQVCKIIVVPTPCLAQARIQSACRHLPKVALWYTHTPRCVCRVCVRVRVSERASLRGVGVPAARGRRRPRAALETNGTPSRHSAPSSRADSANRG